MKIFLGIIFLVFILINLEETILILVVVGTSVGTLILIYGIIANILSKLQEQKKIRTEAKRLNEIKLKQENLALRKQIEKFESGILFGSWKDENISLSSFSPKANLFQK